MSALSDPRQVATPAADQKYYYRRSLTVRELAPAIGAGVAAGLATFYLAKVFLERTPLRVERNEAAPPTRGLSIGARQGRSSDARDLGRR
jgi:hypothetical protein